MKTVWRKVRDRLRIGDQVVINLLAIRGNNVLLKVTVSEAVPIWRSIQRMGGGIDDPLLRRAANWNRPEPAGNERQPIPGHSWKRGENGCN